MKKHLLSLAAALCLSAAFPVSGGAAVADAAVSAQDAGEEIPLIEVVLETPGTLGVEILYQADVLSDVKRLKVAGTFNDADWTTISNLTAIQELDLSAVSSASVPNEAFRGKSRLSSVKLPSNATSIGQNAFYQTVLADITIPTGVTSIGSQAFQRITTLKTVEFEEGSKLKTISDNAFYNCTGLEKIHIPEGCATIQYNAFYYCTSLADLTLPSTLTTIGDAAFYNTNKLTELIFPENLKSIGNNAFGYSGLTSAMLPAGLATLSGNAFADCKSLTKVQLPSYIDRYDYNFRSCTSLKEVICPAATPPAYSSEPFNGVTLSGVILTVPDFAVASYKLDSYWMRFGTIQGGAEVTLCNVAGPLSLTNDRRINGVPDVTLFTGGSITLGGQAPQEFSLLAFQQNFRSANNYLFSQFINNCPSVSSKSLKNSINVYSNTWYFISPMADIKRSEITHSNSSAAMAIRRYDGQKRAENGSGGWTNLADDEMLQAGKGYIIQTNYEGWIYFATALASPQALAEIIPSGDIALPLEDWPAEITANAGWNFLGNPYPSYFDAHFLDFPAPITVYDPNNRNYKAYSLADDNFVLQPLQPFFVQKPDGVGEITFLKEGRQLSSTPNTGAYKAPAMQPSSRLICNVSISGNGLADATRVVINPQASLAYETNCDAAKMMSAEVDALQLWSIGAQNIPMAINERPKEDGYVALAAMLPQAGEYEISLDCADQSVTILDRLTSKKARSHSFTAEGLVDGRFVLEVPEVTSGISDVEAVSGLTVNGHSVCAEVETVVYAVDGRVVAHILPGSSVELPNGVYVAKGIDGSASKFIVKSAEGK
ncbi:MAG: leucine-rich repeat domain-containing protein [Clostridium sp.]|nr:leucine-rich repeat domain-containing protein [Clostridium sp.]